MFSWVKIEYSDAVSWARLWSDHWDHDSPVSRMARGYQNSWAFCLGICSSHACVAIHFDPYLKKDGTENLSTILSSHKSTLIQWQPPVFVSSYTAGLRSTLPVTVNTTDPAVQKQTLQEIDCGLVFQPTSHLRKLYVRHLVWCGRQDRSFQEVTVVCFLRIK